MFSPVRSNVVYQLNGLKAYWRTKLDKIECYPIADWKSIENWEIKANIIMNWLDPVEFNSCKYIHVAGFSVFGYSLCCLADYKKRDHFMFHIQYPTSKWPRWSMALSIYLRSQTYINFIKLYFVCSSMFIVHLVISIRFSFSLVFLLLLSNKNEKRK